MFTVKREENWNQFHQLVYEYYNQRKHTYVHGSTKKAEAEREAWSQGYKNFFLEVLASEVNRRRIEVLTKWDTIPVIIASEATKIEKDIDTLWEVHVQMSPAKKEVDWEALWTALEEVINTAVWSQGLRDSEMHRHRDAVLAGNEEPYAEDKVWLEAIRQKAKDELDRATQLTMEAGRQTSA